MSRSESRIALLIDADNVSASKVQAIVSEVSNHGISNIRKAYGNWKSAALQAWEACLHEHAIRPIQQFDYTKGKNATDAALIIDAMDLLYTQQLDAFAIVSSDCDFTPLVMRILTNGLRVYGFGERKTPRPFVHACSHFFYLETINPTTHVGSTQNAQVALNIQQSISSTSERQPIALPTAQTQTQTSQSPVSARKTGQELRRDQKLVNLLKTAVAETQKTDGWSPLSVVGGYLGQQSWFNLKDYGYAKLSDLFGAIGLFEVRRTNKGIDIRVLNSPQSI